MKNLFRNLAGIMALILLAGCATVEALLPTATPVTAAPYTTGFSTQLPTATLADTETPTETPLPTETAEPMPTPEPTPTAEYIFTSREQLLDISPNTPDIQPPADYTLPCFIEVDVANQCVNIYVKNTVSGRYDVLLNRFVCSTGLGTATPSGSFYIPTPEQAGKPVRMRWVSFPKWNTYGQYALRINGPFLFHSFTFSELDASKPIVAAYDKLGTKASAGCVRLTLEHSKWIYDNIAFGTLVYITYKKPQSDTLKAALKVPPFGTPYPAGYALPLPGDQPTPTPAPSDTLPVTPTPTIPIPTIPGGTEPAVTASATPASEPTATELPTPTATVWEEP